MKFLLVVAFLGMASAATVVGRRGIVRDGVEYFPIEEHLRANPELYPQMKNIPVPIVEEGREQRIVNGNVATHGQFRYQVALFVAMANGNFFCGGIIIGRNTVLTAAHCVVGSLRTVRVVAGAQNIQQSESQQREFVVQASDVFSHREYNAQNLRNDVALINIPGGIGADTQYITIANLPRKSQANVDLTNRPATSSGWGRDSDSATAISPVLRWVEAPVITNQQCNSIYGIIYDGSICLSGANGRSSCNGDSGGPTVVEGLNGAQTVVGVTSFVAAVGCASGNPHGYSRVTYFINWIEANSPVRFEN